MSCYLHSRPSSFLLFAQVPGRASAYEWRDDDPKFAQEWKKAIEVGADLLEEEALRRAVQGVQRPVYQGGRLVGNVREYSDTLLIFLLKGAKPQKYAERTNHNHSGNKLTLEQLVCGELGD